MTDRSDFKKPLRPQPKAFQVTLDLRSGLYIGLGIVAVQFLVGLAQLLVVTGVSYLMR